MGWWSKEAKITEGTTQTTEASKSAVWDNETSKAIADARKAQSKGVGRAKKGEQGTETAQGGVHLSSQIIEQTKKLFNPDAWRAIVKAPFALGQAMTGRSCWELEKEKEDTLAVSTAMTAEYFMMTDPKWVAVSLCAFNWAVIFTEKMAANARERAKEIALLPKKEINPQTPAHLREKNGKEGQPTSVAFAGSSQ